MERRTIEDAFTRLAAVASATASQADQLLAIARRYQDALSRGGTLFFAGNGGSAADAQHIAAEYVVRYSRMGRGAMAALALTTDTSVLTAAGNDLGFEQVFARQVEALGGANDLLILHSTSGQSRNLIAAAHAARTLGVGVVAFLGKQGGPLAALADLTFIVPSDETSRIQEIHLAAEHIIVGLLEEQT